MKKFIKITCIIGAFVLSFLLSIALCAITMFESSIPVNDIIKSIIVICTGLAILCLDVFIIRVSFMTSKKYALKVVAFLLIFISLSVVWSVKDYVYPFERTVDVELVAVIGYPLTENWVDNWQAFYEEYGLYAASFSIFAGFEGHELDFELPEMNLEKYTYIVTYGKKIKKLTYNVWDTIDVPFHTGAKEGSIQFCEEFNHEIYVYRLKKMRIDNPKF